MNLDLQILGSSSKGNCYLLNTPGETLILECGISYKEIQKDLSFDLKKVLGCIVSHSHSDHSKGIKDLTKRSIDVYSSAGTFTTLGIKSHRAIPVEPLKSFDVGGFRILPFDIQHDAIEPLGYLIEHASFGRLLFVTDTFYLKYKFRRLNYVMIECNYSEEIVNRRYENNEINVSVLKRLFNSHFSLENVKEFFRANDLSKLKGIYLMHLSDGNSDSALFKDEIEKLTGVITNVC